MKPIPAVGLASALVQIITFSITILGKEHAVYRPTDPDQPQISNAAILQSIINNLHRLTTQIDKSDLKHLHAEQSAQKKPLKLSEAATHLLKLSEAVKSTTSELCNAFIAAATQARSKPLPSTNDTEPDDKSLWTTPREALLTNSPFKKKDITSTKKKLRSLRREIDTWLLVALRQYLDQSAETGLPVFIAKDSASCLARKASVAKWQNDALDAVHAQGWRGAKKKEVEEFGKVVDELVEVESEGVFREGLFAKLWVEGAEEREMGIKEPLDGTLDWVFDEGGKVVEWLGGREGENLLWVTGMIQFLSISFLVFLVKIRGSLRLMKCSREAWVGEEHTDSTFVSKSFDIPTSGGVVWYCTRDQCGILPLELWNRTSKISSGVATIHTL